SQAAELDLAGHLFDQFVALFLGRFDREAHATLVERCGGFEWAIAHAHARYAAAPRSANVTCSMAGDSASSSRTVSTVIRAASSSGKPPTPVPSAGNATLVAPISRARAIALRTAASMTAPLVRRSRSSETAWITAFAASEPPGVTIASPRGTGAWRTAANSMASPAARLIAPETPVDIHNERFAGLTIASTSRSQMSPFQSSIRANYPLHPVSVRIPTTAPVAAWYTRGSRPDIE